MGALRGSSPTDVCPGGSGPDVMPGFSPDGLSLTKEAADYVGEGSDCLEEDELPASYYGNEDDDEFEYDPALEEIAAMHVDKEDVWHRP